MQQKTKTNKICNMDTALGQLAEAQKQLAALQLYGERLRAARVAMQQATSAVWEAACSGYLKLLVDLAAGQVDVQRRGGKAWLTSTNGAALLYHAPDCGWLNIAGDCGYTTKHAEQLAPVVAVMFGPNMVGVWYETSEGKTHWARLCGDDCKRLRFSLRHADGTVQPMPTSAFDMPQC